MTCYLSCFWPKNKRETLRNGPSSCLNREAYTESLYFMQQKSINIQPYACWSLWATIRLKQKTSKNKMMAYLNSGLQCKREAIKSVASGRFSIKNKSFWLLTIFTSRSRISPNGCLPPVIQKKRRQPRLNKSTARV